MTLGYTFTHAANAAAVCADQLEVIYDALQRIAIHDLQDCGFEFHWIGLFSI